jgi:hypothetical protein
MASVALLPIATKPFQRRCEVHGDGKQIGVFTPHTDHEHQTPAMEQAAGK